MNVRVVLFAKPRELVGQPNVDLALPAGATAADAWSQLSTRYDAYGSMAQKQMEDLAEEARRRWPILDLAVVHRTGTLPVGEVSVVIAVVASHRGEAFDACEWLIDELKHTVPIWKKEIYTEGEAWIDDRP
jgi:molybdopterin synthase catalytic subunit